MSATKYTSKVIMLVQIIIYIPSIVVLIYNLYIMSTHPIINECHKVYFQEISSFHYVRKLQILSM